MTQIALPTRRARSVPTWILFASGAGALIVLGILGLYASKALTGGSTSSGDFKTVQVREGPFESRVSVKGELQAVDNIDIVCQVEGSTVITQIVPEGTYVKKGEQLVVLDSSQIRQKLEDSQIELQRATADVTAAEEMLEIQKSQNAANLEAAEVALQLAKIDYTKFVEGSYPSLLADAKMALEKAQTNLKTKQDDLSQTRALFSKGFVTATEVKTRELDVASFQRDVVKAETDLKVLEQYTYQADLASKKSALAQAEQKLERTKRENAANLSQKNADLAAKKQQLDVIQRRATNYKDQIAHCSIVAPADGLVVYQNNNQMGRDTPAVAEGAQVRERQVLMRLPDTSHMKVVLKINESQVSGLTIGQEASVNLTSLRKQMVGKVSKISPVADSGDRWMNPDRKDYPVDVILNETPQGLRPGMTAEVSILIDRVDDALSIPLASLYSAGADRYAFVIDGNNVNPTKVKLGRSNDADVQIRDGLDAGQSVVLLEAGQGKLLLEKAGIKVADTQPQGAPGEGRRRRNGGNGEGGGQGGAGAPGAPGAAPRQQQPEAAPQPKS